MATDKSLQALVAAREHDPYKHLGLHRNGASWRVRVYRPHAASVALDTADGPVSLARRRNSDFFEWSGEVLPFPQETPYRLIVDEEDGGRSLTFDPYAFPPLPREQDAYLFSQGSLYQAYRFLGANSETRRGVEGICFRVWAPNAERVSVVGDFNRWDGRMHPMGSLGASGIWELFLPGLAAGALYKFEIRNRHTGALLVKSDPYAREWEKRPATAARVGPAAAFAWNDDEWMTRRAACDWLHAPMTTYELHLGSWMRHPDGSFYSYRELAERLVPYVADLNFTHVEMMPLMEHPLDESWGYQCTGYFAPTSRFGSPDDLRFLIDAFHAAGIGVILDWVPGHFPRDEFALAHFDGSALYEHEDPRLKVHPDWGTYVFNFGRNEVRSFLLSSAHYWLSEFHADGLRVDAVASMLYLDYSRRAGEWLPNRFGGRENLEAIDFLRTMNEMVHRDFPGALTIAEESTAWPMVSRPVYLGGLGFSMKWNMGWMNDTLAYMSLDPIHRRFHHDRLTFGQVYAYSENFVLPLSHDEVVHGKGSLLGKMPGDDWQRRASVRLLMAYQATAPGKKLTFMGNELAMPGEWSESRELSWELLANAEHAGLHRLQQDLNGLVRNLPALHVLDFEARGFEWIDCHDAEQSVVAWLRLDGRGNHAAVLLNFTPLPRTGYRIGLPAVGPYREILNTDSRHYGGSDIGNGANLEAEPTPWMGRPASVMLTLPPLAAIVLVPVRD